MSERSLTDLLAPLLYWGIFLCALGTPLTAEVGSLVGTVSINLEAADSPEEPTYLITGATLSEDPVFQGAVFSASGNVLTFSQIQDEELPHLNVDPFAAGVLASSKARATAVIDATDGNVTQITVDYAGSGYVGIPEVQISYPDSGSDPSTAVNAEANATISAGGVISIIITEGGKGYTTAPTVNIEGGSHFLRITEPDGDYEGRFFLITANDGTTLTLDNPANEDFVTIFPQDTNVEIVSAHSLGSVFGITDCLLSEGNSTAADLIYLYDPNATDANPDSGYVAHYNDGTGWKRESNASSSDDLILYPDEAFIIARRANTDLELEFSGNLLSVDMQAMLPATGQQRLLNNPFGMDVLLTELIDFPNLTADTSVMTKWYAHDEDEVADNLRILNGGVWTSYWHANVNMGVTTMATAIAVSGTGSGNAITVTDVTLTEQGAGYTTNPKIYFVGGGGSGGYGTATLSGGSITSITLENGGSGYTSAPVVVISSGGWRRQNSFADPADDEIISAGAGILIIRRHPNGTATFIQSDNPSN